MRHARDALQVDIGPTHAIGRTLGEQITLKSTNWLNLRFVTPLDIALRLGAPFLVERGIDPSRAMSPRTGTRYASGSSSDLLHSEIEPPSQK